MLSNSVTANDGRVSADGSPLSDQGRFKLVFSWYMTPGIGDIGEDAGRAAEDVVLQGYPLEDGDIILHFHIVTYSSPNDIGILDERHRQHMHIYYIQRRFPHNLHLTFLDVASKPVFTRILQACFPKTEINWVELDEPKDES